ncbi:sigma 54-interacting transcriptional regulator [Thermanaerothrix sp. 4228-RoL]|uniref:Sigma 54-interacting transcriptional regulator n=1 Tax=Thermanaerothrix solaris TaxID=3058434 RepID=A0ABU3NK76_9CHLR|nr:sigma 54-interacting transcriptional regulator [Thermanaerothrix sp. 4228-RoL]MDT8897256.1 sigma 54-interacting transcriptional regulator [Thermanaerothrix sp. 4228-RoL]
MDRTTKEQLYDAWHTFITRHIILPQVRPIIATSWQRCWARVDPYALLKPPRLSDQHLFSMQVNHFELMAIARPVMEDIYQYIENSNSVVLFANSVGYLLDRVGDPGMLATLESLQIVPGALLAESELGTNAIGVALLEREPLQVVGYEHFSQPLHDFGWAAAPVFDISGKLLGALGIATRVSNFHPYALGLVVAGARAIEAQRQSDQLLEEQNSQLAGINAVLSGINEGILVWNTDGVVIHANPAAAEILKVAPETLMGSHLDAFVKLPPYVLDALHRQIPISDLEVNLSVLGETISCLLSLQYVRGRRGIRAILAILRPLKTLREYVQRQVGSPTFDLQNLVGESPAIRRVRRLARSAAAARGCVLIRGESGTGKNLLARAIHYHSPRSHGPFVVFACTAVPSELVLPELLGVERGVGEGVSHASKFELADGGTLFFQDVDALPLEAQSVLLNYLELGIIQRIGSRKPVEVDVRIIASSSADLEHLVAEGNFRADLFYRLSLFEIVLPPLRERKQDLELLIEQILQRLARQLGHPLSLSRETLGILRSHSWPGNVRELESVLTRAAVQASPGHLILPVHLPPLQTGVEMGNKVWTRHLPPLEEIERQAILQAAQQCHGNVSQMARLLGVGRTTLWRHLRRMNISLDAYREDGGQGSSVSN